MSFSSILRKIRLYLSSLIAPQWYTMKQQNNKYSILYRIFSWSPSWKISFLVVRTTKKLLPLLQPQKSYDFRKWISNKIYYFISLCLRVLQLPMIFILPNIKVSILLLICSMISFLFILGVLDNLIFGSLLVSSSISGTIQFKTLFYLFIRVILLISIIITSVYCNFNMIVRIINYIRSFIHLPKLGFKENWDLILFYYIYSTLFFLLSLRFQINILIKFQHLECFDLYLLITLWASIVLCINYIDIFNKKFNSNKGFRFNLERVLLILGGYITLYFIYILLWSQYSSVFEDILQKHLSDKGVLKTSAFYMTSPTPTGQNETPSTSVEGELPQQTPSTTTQGELPQQSTQSFPDFSVTVPVPNLFPTSPFSIQNNDILKWWENRQHSSNEPFPEQPQVLDPTIYSNPIRKVSQPTPFVPHNINQVPDWWENRQHNPNEPYPNATSIIDPSMFSNEPFSEASNISGIHSQSSEGLLKRSYTTAFEADSSVSAGLSHSNTNSKVARYEGSDSSKILFDPASVGINYNGPLDLLLQSYTPVIAGNSGLGLEQSSSDGWNFIIDNNVQNMSFPEYSNNQTELNVRVSEESATTSTSVPIEQLLEQIKELSNKVSSIQEVQLKLARIVRALCSPSGLHRTSQNVSIPIETGSHSSIPSVTKDSSIPSSSNLVGANEPLSYSSSSPNVCTPEDGVAKMKRVVETQAPIKTEEPSMRQTLSRNIPLRDVQHTSKDVSVGAYYEYDSPLSPVSSRDNSPEVVEISKPEGELFVNKGKVKFLLNETPSNLPDKGKGKAKIEWDESPSNLLDKGKGKAKIDWSESPREGYTSNTDTDSETGKWNIYSRSRTAYSCLTIDPMSCRRKDIVLMRDINDSRLHTFRLTEVYDSIIQDPRHKINYQYDDSSPGFFQKLFKIYEDNWKIPYKKRIKYTLGILADRAHSVDFNNEIFLNQSRCLIDVPNSGCLQSLYII